MTPTLPSQPERLSGLKGFTLVWLGQIISVLASSMSHFGLTIWMYQQTASATAMGLMQVAFLTPFLLLSPIAGVLVDRANRKLMMMLSDLAAVLATGGILALYATGHLEFWHLYISAAINGLGNTFQWPAYSAAISTMLPKEQYGRAYGMMSLVESGPGVIAPLLAGVLLPLLGLTGILTLDLVTFFLAIGALAIVHIPQPPVSQEGQRARGSLRKEAAFGFKYIFARPSLRGLVILFLVANLFSGMAWAVFAPLILARTGSNSVIFASVQTAAAIGGVAGGLLMSAWGGPKRRIHGILAGWTFSNLCGVFVFGLGHDLSVWIPAIVIVTVVGPVVVGSSQAIWQAKVPPDVQGRVFAARRLVAWITQPLAPVIAGTLADFVLEPAMQTTGSGLARLLGGLVGTGPGAGMSVLFLISGAGVALCCLVGYTVRAIRDMEDLLPDHDALLLAAPAPESQAEPAATAAEPALVAGQ